MKSDSPKTFQPLMTIQTNIKAPLGNHFCTGNGGDIEQHGEPIEANKLA